MLAIQCIVEGFPPPTVSWTHNGTLLPECTLDLLNMLIVCAEFGERERGDSSSSLLIISAKLSDTGRYECTAQNSAGVAVYEVYVAVERAISMHKFHSSDVRIALTHSLSLSFSGLPSFLVYPAPVTVVNGSLITLDCLVRGEPAPSIIWLKDFTPVNLTSGIMVEGNGTLVITDASLEDAGFYTCVADNGLGINQVSVPVEVIPEVIVNKTGLLVCMSLCNISSNILSSMYVCVCCSWCCWFPSCLTKSSRWCDNPPSSHQCHSRLLCCW